jgi:hypothetical protein
MKTMIECERNHTYRSNDGYTLKRIDGTIHHNDWQLTDNAGTILDLDKLRFEIANRNYLDLVNMG